jgi:hypothetical protein
MRDSELTFALLGNQTERENPSLKILSLTSESKPGFSQELLPIVFDKVLSCERLTTKEQGL